MVEAVTPAAAATFVVAALTGAGVPAVGAQPSALGPVRWVLQSAGGVRGLSDGGPLQASALVDVVGCTAMAHLPPLAWRMPWLQQQLHGDEQRA